MHRRRIALDPDVVVVEREIPTSTISIVISSGASSIAALSAARLNEPLRRLPAMAATFDFTVTHCSPLYRPLSLSRRACAGQALFAQISPRAASTAAAAKAQSGLSRVQ